jgi:hypothetical protein
MRPRNYWIVAIALTCILAVGQTGCVSNKRIAKSWVGHHIDDLILEWGKPDSHVPGDSGGYTYTFSQKMSDSDGHEWACNWIFKTNEHDRIASVSAPSQWSC